MNFFRIIGRLSEIDRMLKLETTGNPEEFAEHLHVSLRQLYYIVEELRDYGVPIKYDRHRRTYYYEDYFDLKKFVRDNT